MGWLSSKDKVPPWNSIPIDREASNGMPTKHPYEYTKLTNCPLNHGAGNSDEARPVNATAHQGQKIARASFCSISDRAIIVFLSFFSERDHRIHSGGAPCRQVTGDRADSESQDDN